MKYAGFMPNDFLNGKGISVSLWTQGCPFHCKGCHNQDAWNQNSGYDVPENLVERLKSAINANGIQRNFSILGGEPLAEYNRGFISNIITEIRKSFPNIKIFLWTGYTYEALIDMHDKDIDNILDNINTLIDGQFIEEKRDITLDLRGSSNQRIIELH